MCSLAPRHVVAQVVEAELGVRPVGHVRGVGGALVLEVLEVGPDAPDAEPQEAVELAHPVGVACGQVVVHRDDVDALAGESAFRYTGSVETRVLPSPVFISAIHPKCSAMPPISWTS